MAVIKGGTYRFKDSLSPAGLYLTSTWVEASMPFTTTAYLDLTEYGYGVINSEVVCSALKFLVNESGDSIGVHYVVASTNPDISELLNGEEVWVYNGESGGNGWNKIAVSLQDITVTEDTDVSNQFYLEFDNAIQQDEPEVPDEPETPTTPTRKFARLHIGDTVYESGGRCFKVLTKDEPMPQIAGLYDENNNILASWDELVNTYGMDCERNYTLTSWESDKKSPYNVLTKTQQLLSGTKLIIDNSVTSIGKYAFRNCENITSITIPNSVIFIGENAFEFCEGLKKVYFLGNAKDWFDISFESADSNPMSYAKELYFNGELVQNLVIPDGVTEIKRYTLYLFRFLQSITIPLSVTSIEEGAFTGCSGLEEVYYLGDVEDWVGISFGNSSSNPMYFCGNVYFNGKQTNDVVIPDGVTSICDYAFANYKGITSVTISNSVNSIGESAFRNAIFLESVTMGVGVTYVGYQAFYNCENIAKVYYNGDVGDWAGISLSDSELLYGGAELYFNGKLETEIVIPEFITSIGEGAFEYCEQIQSLTILGAVESFGKHAFGRCKNLESVTIGDGVTYISEEAFESCKSLNNITIPVSVGAVEKFAFSGCSNLTTVYYKGTEAQWKNINIGSFNSYLTNATIHYNYQGGDLT